MAGFAKDFVLANATASEPWKHLARHPTAYDFLLSHNPIRHQGNSAAHRSQEPDIAESIFGLTEGSQDRAVMTMIFTAYYGHPPAVQGL